MKNLKNLAYDRSSNIRARRSKALTLLLSHQLPWRTEINSDDSVTVFDSNGLTVCEVTSYRDFRAADLMVSALNLYGKGTLE